MIIAKWMRGNRSSFIRPRMPNAKGKLTERLERDVAEMRQKGPSYMQQLVAMDEIMSSAGQINPRRGGG